MCPIITDNKDKKDEVQTVEEILEEQEDHPLVDKSKKVDMEKDDLEEEHHTAVFEEGVDSVDEIEEDQESNYGL